MVLVVLPVGVHRNVPPPIFGVAVSMAFWPKQILSLVTVSDGCGVTNIVAVSIVGGQTDPGMPYDTVYWVLLSGVTVMLCVVCAPGAHVYVPPDCEGMAVSVAALP